MIERKVGFIGAGRMAEALARGMLRAGVASAQNLYASDPSEQRRLLFSADIGAHTLAENTGVMGAAEVVVLAVKPQIMPAVADEIASAVTPAHLIVSIAPGIPLAWFEERLGTDRLVRVMPNTPALVGEGAAAFCRGRGTDDSDAAVLEQMLSAVGICVEVEEKLMDAVTGLSGSGPAYVYLAIEALSDGGVKMGLPRQVATRLAAQTVLGAAKMVLESRKHPGELKDEVTTPGGTTIEGLHALEKAGTRKAFIDAVEAAALRSKQLGERDRGGRC